MSRLLHLKDKFDNDMWFGDAGGVRMPAMPNVSDFSGQLDRVRNTRLRADDVIVVGYPKSGNNWIHHMVTMLKEGTTDLPCIFRDESFAFLDAFSSDQQLPPPDKPRTLLSHLPLRYLPRDVTDKQVKIVYVTRNPKDVFVSLFCHVSQVKLPLGYGGTWSQFFHVMLDQGFWYGDYFDHLKDWEKEIKTRPHLPIYHCNFEDTKLDTFGQVERLNRFLETSRSRQLCAEIVETCHVGNMHKSRHQSEAMTRNIWLWKDGVPMSNFFRKGIIGDWKNWFTVAQNEQFDEIYRSKMADSSRKFIFE